MDYFAFWIVATCALVNVACGTLGCFLVLRRMSLIGDAISHAVLPGIAIAFIATQSRSPLAMLIGAGVAGMVTVVLMHLVQRLGNVAEDSAMGVVFTSLFALGVILIHVSTHGSVDLDPGCVLYGLVEFVPLDTVMVGSMEIPRAALTLMVALGLVIAFVAAFWKELKISSFDPQLATTLGINATLMHYLLMMMVAIVTVAAFESVGSILVVAALIVPAATASLLTNRLLPMLLISAEVGISSAYFGRLVAVQPAINTSVAGMVAVLAGAHLALAVVFSPGQGLLARRITRFNLALRIEREHVLALLWRWNELHPDTPMPRRSMLTALGSGWMGRLALRRLLTRGAVVADAAHDMALRLAPGGEDTAQELVRRHRLWEMWLNKRLGVEPTRVHPSADRMEHFLTDDIVKEVVDDVGFTDTDPHGKRIPWRESDARRFRVEPPRGEEDS